jgi:hypothetical protein
MVPDDRVSFVQSGPLVWIMATNDKIIKGCDVGKSEYIELDPDKLEAVTIASNADQKPQGGRHVISSYRRCFRHSDVAR